MLTGDIDTTYHTVQRDLFASGLAAQIGANAFAVWSAIKVHADFESGKAWPSIRRIGEMTGLGKSTVARAVDILEEVHMLRKETQGWPGRPGSKSRGRTPTYVARERLDVKLGSRVLCTIVVDYVPYRVHAKLRALKEALTSGSKPKPGEPDIWAEVTIVPGPGFVWDESKKVLTSKVSAAEVPATPEVEAALLSGEEARLKLKSQAASIKAKAARQPLLKN
jgi:Helix-turn-helix domain